MGTSTPYNGPQGGTPLIPSWLNDPTGNNLLPNGQIPTNSNVPPLPLTIPSIPKIGDPNRFRSSRKNFTQFIKSDGSDRSSLGRAVASYVSTSVGGARRAAQRMGSSRGASARLINFLVDVQKRGQHEALRALNLEALVNHSITDILMGLADYICPGSSTVDEGIARDAYIETVIELVNDGLEDLSTLSSDQVYIVLEIYAANAIKARICNDIGNKIVSMPDDLRAAQNVEKQLNDFIRGGVSDALAGARLETSNFTFEKINAFVNSVYENAFNILQVLGDAEENK